MTRHRAWFRPRRAPPEVWFLTAVVLLAAWLYSLATAPPRPATVASIAPACADAAQPCRGRAQ